MDIRKVLHKNPVVRVVAFFHSSRSKRHVDSFSVDIILSESDTNLSYLKKRVFKEGIEQRKSHLGFKNCIRAVGYTRKQNQHCYDFVESFTNEQWCIALSNVLSDPDLVITVKVIEAKVVHSLSETTSLRCADRPSQTVQQRQQSISPIRPTQEIQNQPEHVFHVTGLTEPQPSVTFSAETEEFSLESFDIRENFSVLDTDFTIDTFSTNPQFSDSSQVSPPKRARLNGNEEAVMINPPNNSLSMNDKASDSANIINDDVSEVKMIDMEQPALIPLQISEEGEDDVTTDDLNDAFGPNWYDQSDIVVKNLHELLSSGELPKEHICYKFIKDIIGYIYCMTKQDRYKQIKWSWDKDVKEFLRSIRKIGKKRVLRLMRGPAKDGKGRWSEFDINSFNIPIPSLDTISRDKGKSYTPRSGIVKQFLQGFIKMAMEHAQPIEHTNLLKCIPVVRSVDGFGLKAGCQRDQIINELIGATVKIDIDYIEANPRPDPAQLRDLLIKEAESEVLTTLDCSTTLPVGVNYIGTKTGEETYDDMKVRVKQIQICELCLEYVNDDISCIRDNGESCISTCVLCCEEKELCATCREKGFESVNPSLRPCNRCLEKGLQCRKLVVVFNSSDCGSNYKKAMKIHTDLLEKDNIDVSIQLLHAMPDIIHVVKCLSCSMTNWFLIVGGHRVNTSLLRVIRETEPLGTHMRRVLPLEAVKQRDRMRSQTPRELSDQRIWNLFSCKQLCGNCKRMPSNTYCQDCQQPHHDRAFCQNHVVSPLVPEKWRLSEDNKEGTIEKPLCICRGPPSTFFVCNKSSIYSLRLHYPVQIKLVAKDYSHIPCIAYNSGVLLISDLSSGRICFLDYLATLTPKIPQKKADIRLFLEERGVAVDAKSTVRELRSKAKEYLSKNKKNDNTLIEVAGVTAMEFCASDLVYLASINERAVLEVSLAFADFSVKGHILRRFQFPGGGECIPGSLCLTMAKILYTNLSQGGGLYMLDLETGLHSNLVRRSGETVPHGLAVVGSTVYFTDTKSRQIKSMEFPVDGTEPNIKVHAGNGIAARRYGLSTTASFGQPSSIVSDGNSLLVCDTGVNAVSLVSSIKPLYLACKQYGTLFDVFGVHADTKYVKACDALQTLTDVIQFYEKCQSDIRDMFNLPPEKKLDGSLGSPASDTIASLTMVLQSVQRVVTKFPTIDVTTKALTTQVNEHLFAKARELGLNEAVGCLDFAINFPSIVEEVMKRITRLPFIFYTHPKSYYEIPQDFIKFEDLPAIPKPAHVSLPTNDIAKMNDYRKKWLEAVRVATVRSETTKHRFSTLPIGLYEVQPPENDDVDFNSLLMGNSSTTEEQRKIIFYQGTVFYKPTEERETLAINVGDVYEGNTTVCADLYVQCKENIMQFCWERAEPALDLSCYSATGIPIQSVERLAEEGEIVVTEDQYENLQAIRLDNDVESYDGDSDSDSESEEIQEQISRCNMITQDNRSRRNVKAPARYNDFF